VIGVFYILKANYKSPYFFHKEKHPEKDIIRIQLSENVSFLNKASIVLTLEHLPDNSHVIIDGSKSTFIDYDVLEAIQDFRISARDRNIQVEMIDVPEVAKVAAH
jgi:MFS superfamily sulfate permease-like transporter